MRRVAISILLIVTYYILLSTTHLDAGTLEASNVAILYIFVPLVGIPLVVTYFGAQADQGKARKGLNQELSDTGFDPTDRIVLASSALFIDRQQGKLCIADVQDAPNQPSTYFIYSPEQILSCSIVTDGEEITTASNPSVVGRALVGGLLFGGVGAIVGGTTSARVGGRRIKSLELRILVDDPKRSSHRISFFNHPKGAPATSNEVKPNLDAIEIWQTKIELLMAGEPIPNFSSVQQLQDHLEVIRLKRARTTSS